MEDTDAGTGTDSVVADTGTGTPPDTETTEGTDTEVVTDSGEPLPTIHCDSIPLAPTAVTQLEAPRGFHDLAFDAHGNVFGNERAGGGSIIRADSWGNASVFVPSVGQLQGFDWLHSGELIVASDTTGALHAYSEDASSRVVTADVYAYGLVVGPTGKIYVANHSDISRVDPDTGHKQLVYDPADPVRPRVLNFSPDFTKLYYGTSMGDSSIYVVDLDAELMPTGEASVLAVGVGFGHYHDTLGVDACGNLYIADYNTRVLWRVSPSGRVQDFYRFNPHNLYGHGLKWGSGLDGWKTESIYMTQPYFGDRVIELDIGVPSSAYPGPVIPSF